MLRILWILSLALVIGAQNHDSWKSFFESLAHEFDQSRLKSWSIFPEVLKVISETYPTNPCESDNCHPDFSPTSPASPVDTSKPGTLHDYSFPEDSLASSSHQNLQQVGSMKGIPGLNFPDYTDIPVTSFSCSDQDYVPGFYADLESGCQVFHACWPHRRESFLCPVGTTFNQALLACDYWYSSNCSLAPHYYNVNGYSMKSTDTKDTPESSMINVLLGTVEDPSKDELKKIIASETDTMTFISQFLPVKAKVTVYPETPDSKSKIVAMASVGNKRKKRHLSTKSKDSTQKPQSTTSETVVAESTPYSTRSPDCQTVKYINVEAAVKMVLDRLDNIFKNIMRELKEYTAPNAKKACSITRTNGISTLSKIKHMLVQRPVLSPAVIKSYTTSKTDSAVDATEPPVNDFHRKPVDSRIKHPKVAISPLTKKALIESYMKLLKLRRN